MKNTINKYFGLIIAFSLLIACEDILETIPNDRVSSAVFWKSEQDAETALNSIYAALDDINLFVLDGITDIGHTNTTFTVEWNIENGTYDASHSRIQTEWENGYRGIFLANEFLANIDKIESSNPGLIDRFTAEAKFLRAYFYMKLVGLYGDVPFITSPIDIENSTTIERTSKSTVWKFVFDELNEVANKLPESYDREIGRVTRGAALGLKARAGLWAEDYSIAAEAAKLVIDSRNYQIIDDYDELFTYEGENNNEIIFDKQFLQGTNTHNVFAFMGPRSQNNSNSTFVPTKALADLYPMQNGKYIDDPESGFDPYNPYSNRDPRLKFTLFVDGDILPSGIVFKPVPGEGGEDEIGKTQYISSTGYSLKKYISDKDLSTPSASGLNIILLRYAEILLTYAEAKIELGQIDNSVYDAINKVRNRTSVNLPALPNNLSQSELREIVRRERVIELAFEGWHLFDIRRWKTAETVMPGKVFGITYADGDGLTTIEVPTVSKVFNAGKHYLWPVPQKELLLNPSLGQNPGW